MKLIYCTECSDIVALRIERRRFCSCGESWGVYTDLLSAEIGGPAIPLGMTNDSLKEAIRRRPEEGWGKKINAFVIPRRVPTVNEGERT